MIKPYAISYCIRLYPYSAIKQMLTSFYISIYC